MVRVAEPPAEPQPRALEVVPSDTHARVLVARVVHDERVVVVERVGEYFVAVQRRRERRRERFHDVRHQAPHPDLVHDQPRRVHRVRAAFRKPRDLVRVHLFREHRAEALFEEVERVDARGGGVVVVVPVGFRPDFFHDPRSNDVVRRGSNHRVVARPHRVQ
eukprot:18879-Pelagococcus_subviridis.AAC.5